jgi:hypothetical protein
VITGASYEIRSTDVLDALGWQTLDVKRLENKLIMMYKILNNHAAPNLNERFCKRNTIQSNYDLRSNDTDLCLPKPNSEFLKKTFRYSGAIQWNHLSEDLKILKLFLLLKEKYVRHEHLLWITPIVKFLYNSFSIILCFLVF